MGKLIQFPIARIRARRAAAVFGDFGDLASLERAQLKLFGACASGAVALSALLQLAVG